MAADRRLITVLRRELKAAGDPARAPGMQAYMKSTMPYYGVNTPGLRRITKALFDGHPLTDVTDWTDTVLELWRAAKFREERYAAIELTGHRLYRANQTPGALSIYDEMLVTGAWWDYVDAVAIHRVGPLLRAYPDDMRPVISAWSTDDDLWRRRTSIICQISFRGDADLGLLYDCIDANLDDRDFFIRKGIGWALRTYAWSDPDEVVRYVTSREDRLSALSKREALKNVNRGRTSARSRG
jgi:3-methyladenine DNA glycosylase AlkD